MRPTCPPWSKIPLALGLTLLAGAGVANAVTFRVNSYNDRPDPNPGDRICGRSLSRFPLPGRPGIPTECTLRAAIQESNRLRSSDVVLLSAGIYKLKLGELVVGGRAGIGIAPGLPGTLTIRPAAPEGRTSIQGDGKSRIFHTLGDVFLRSPLALERINLSRGFVRGDGGAIRAEGPVSLTQVTITGSRALRPEGASGGSGAAIAASARVTMTDVTVRANQAANQGVVFLDAGGDLERVSISQNRVTEQADGALYGRDMNVRNSTLSGNTGIDVEGVEMAAEVTSLSNTVLDMVTIASRRDLPQRSLQGDDLGLGGLQYTLHGSIIDGTCVTSLVPASQGGNVERGDTCNLTDATDVRDADPLIGEIGQNGGVTSTIPLLPGSPALGIVQINCPTTDQRGVARPAEGCDAGAFEAP